VKKKKNIETINLTLGARQWDDIKRGWRFDGVKHGDVNIYDSGMDVTSNCDICEAESFIYWKHGDVPLDIAVTIYLKPKKNVLKKKIWTAIVAIITNIVTTDKKTLVGSVIIIIAIILGRNNQNLNKLDNFPPIKNDSFQVEKKAATDKQTSKIDEDYKKPIVLTEPAKPYPENNDPKPSQQSFTIGYIKLATLDTLKNVWMGEVIANEKIVDLTNKISINFHDYSLRSCNMYKSRDSNNEIQHVREGEKIRLFGSIIKITDKNKIEFWCQAEILTSK